MSCERISLTFICKNRGVLKQIISDQLLASFQDALDLDFKSYYDEVLMV